MTKFPIALIPSLKTNIIQQIDSLENRLDECENPQQILPLAEEFLKTLYRVTNNSKAERELTAIISARRMALICNQKINRSRTTPAGSGKVARTKKK